MKKIYTYIALATALWAVVGCITADLNQNIQAVENGDDVKFGLSLQNPDTMTVYGDESGNAFPIYWVDGDKVTVFSPQSLEGRRSAEYKVTVNEPKNFADQLTRTGEYGIQWGEGYSAVVDGNSVNGLHDFYSLYPSGNYTLSEDGALAEGVTIYYNQNVVVGETSVKSDMQDCLMYAATTQVEKGDVVNLRYKPISTVLYVTLSVAANEVNTPVDEFTIQSVTLTAGDGTYIAGTFSLDIHTGQFAGYDKDNNSKVVNASNVVSAQIAKAGTGEFVTLVNNQSVSVPLFLTPDPNLNANGWKLTVIANNEKYTKTLKLDDGVLTPGKIHKVSLPQFSVAKSEWDAGSWMERVPRNVYLSEISIPGSWDTINAERQGDTTIEGQYKEGVRAFHYDTRWRTSANSSFLGYTSGSINGLSVAGSAESAKYDGNDRVVLGRGRTFEDHLDDIVAKLTPKEYMVLVCTFAQDSYNYNGDNGLWYGEISSICAKGKYNGIIYDARDINHNTVVGDVLGHLIVIINMADEIVSDTDLPKDSKCFFTYLPSRLEAKHFDGTDDNQDNIWVSSPNSKAFTSGLLLYNNQAQVMSSTGSGISHNDRGYAPSETERTGVLNKILKWSKENYNRKDYDHDMWIYLGLGGYQVNSKSSDGFGSSTVATIYNKWINTKVQEMGTTPNGQTTAIPYYPVGIVLMNFVTDASLNLGTAASPIYTKNVVKNILLLNNRYQLQFDPSKPIDWDPNVTTASDYAATASNGGSAISLD